MFMEHSEPADGTRQLIRFLTRIQALIGRYDNIIAVIITIAAFFIRARYTGHIVSGDDADNYLQVKRLLAGRSLAELELKHPPLLILLGALAAKIAGLKAATLIYLNVLLSTLSIAVVFIITKRWFGGLFALAAAAFLALAPNNIFFSVWYKQDMLLALLLILALYAWHERRFVWAGLALGLAFLTKENAVIIIAVLLVDTIWRRDRESASGFLKMIIATCLFAGWWYAFFMGDIYGARGGLYDVVGLIRGNRGFGAALKAETWFYFKRLGLDIGYAALPFLALGFLSPSMYRDRSKRLFLLWFLLGYLAVSVAAAKAAWFVSPYMVPAAVIAAEGLRLVKSKAGLAAGFASAALALILSLALIFSFSYNTYCRVSSYPTFYSYMFKTVGHALEIRMKPGQKVAAPFKESLLQYFANLDDDQVILLPDDSHKDMKAFIIDNRIDYVVLWQSEVFFDVGRVIRQQRQLSKLIPDAQWINIWGAASIVPVGVLWRE